MYIKYLFNIFQSITLIQLSILMQRNEKVWVGQNTNKVQKPETSGQQDVIL